MLRGPGTQQQRAAEPKSGPELCCAQEVDYGRTQQPWGRDGKELGRRRLIQTCRASGPNVSRSSAPSAHSKSREASIARIAPVPRRRATEACPCRPAQPPMRCRRPQAGLRTSGPSATAQFSQSDSTPTRGQPQRAACQKAGPCDALRLRRSSSHMRRSKS
jgi:hypothetical protein